MNGSALTLVASPRFAEHTTPPGHPERPERAEVFDVVAGRWAARGASVLEPRPATREELLRVHAAEYVDRIAATTGRAVALDPDTFTSPESFEIAGLAAGAACQAADAAWERCSPAAALVRPPGHHAEADRAMGFCLFNSVAVAAAHARTALGAARVAIVDFDVHHGNATQWMFYDDPSVLYVSLHQFPFYPGTGAADETGRGEGRGFTVNLPLAAGATDADYDVAFRTVVTPILDAFAPELVLVSAGYDAHDRDPLAGMRVSTLGFASMMGHLWGVARRHARGRLALVTEGGYDLVGLSEGLDVSLQVLASTPVETGPAAGESTRGQAAAQAARRALLAFWPTL